MSADLVPKFFHLFFFRQTLKTIVKIFFFRFHENFQSFNDRDARENILISYVEQRT